MTATLSVKKTFLFLFCFFTLTNAQIRIGLSSGINFASYSLSNQGSGTSLENKAGFLIGALAEYLFLEKLSARVMLKYSQLGGKNTINSFGTWGTVHNKIYLNYLEFSSYFVYTLFQKTISTKIIGGASLGYLTNSKFKNEFAEGGLKSITKSFNMTMDIALESEIPILQRTSLLLNGGYSFGLTNVNKEGGEMKTKNLSFGIGFLYSL
ncbi:outer membrane beta-barrel protein [Melioribacteraceae bacterium 4301-Me]|uniref:outer membrane beta-barrel protein n=1 Tax=Pyranulibacter aquaticus TaxID=3163344 RepID=UPI00359BE452